MDLHKRPVAPVPYNQLPPVPSFRVESQSFVDGGVLAPRLGGDSGNTSPHLAWSGLPADTKSLMINCFDPDAPTPAGYWHWSVVDLPAATTSLDCGAGASDSTLPAGFHVRNDNGSFHYDGPYPPQGDRPHRYYFAVHALDTPTLNLSVDASPTEVAFNALFHTLARGVIMGTYQR
ncbi:YbhB/YbcL family Raf kinase inhibitor-like protein [Actinomycetaceae bacterium WB03_NA08]|uniref:YbhB/YbcL family Raf kinase inhibitor-like protein n=1 Tax=Scrofimicrobium canadense TaxID=2652290 RepID=A0A6N7VV69_9ACTO|nr:YbhB/YbcL family Raf kinase inhibitor-like protein [Scrofimicrobium canadense]MSS84880.1 YbhB/YbcL family Raf kinase inhibitor-like protein [Scrofimicrobium canadense]